MTGDNIINVLFGDNVTCVNVYMNNSKQPVSLFPLLSGKRET
jgi:hypothetical protein